MTLQKLPLTELMWVSLNTLGREALKQYHNQYPDRPCGAPANTAGRLCFTLQECLSIFGPILRSGQSPFSEDCLHYSAPEKSAGKLQAAE